MTLWWVFLRVISNGSTGSKSLDRDTDGERDPSPFAWANQAASFIKSIYSQRARALYSLLYLHSLNNSIISLTNEFVYSGERSVFQWWSRMFSAERRPSTVVPCTTPITSTSCATDSVLIPLGRPNLALTDGITTWNRSATIQPWPKWVSCLSCAVIFYSKSCGIADSFGRTMCESLAFW